MTLLFRATLFALLILAFATTPVSGQVIVRGEVMAGGQPLPFAHISLEGSSSGTTADEQGHFEIRVDSAGSHQLRISMLGYLTYRREILPEPGTELYLGQIDLSEDVLGLEEVVVTGTLKEVFITSSPIKVEVINSRYLEKNIAPTNLMESIRLINGVEEVVECGVCSTNSLRINGLEGAYTAVLVDGTPMFGNLASVYGLNGIPASIIDRMEVIRGPSSTLYGSEAVAGVINIITKAPTSQPLLSADVRGTSHRESFGNIAFAPKIGKWNTLMGFDYGYANEFQDDNADGFGDFVALDRYSLFGKWSMDRPDQKPFSIMAKYYFEDRRNGIFEYLRDRNYRTLRGSDRVYGESIYTNRFELFGTYGFGGSENIRIDYSFSHHFQDSYYGADFYEARQNIGYANLIWDRKAGRHDWVLGGTFRYQAYDDNTVATPAPDNQLIPGIFAQDEWFVNERLSILAGMRLDFYSAHSLITSPRLNFKYGTGDWTTLRLNFGTGFRMVNLFTEDHAFVSGQRQVDILEELAPERSYNTSLNLNHIYNFGDSQGTIDIDLFYTYFTNKIIPDYDTPGRITYANTDGNAISRGASLSIAHSFLFPLTLNLGFTLQEVIRNERSPETGAVVRSAVEYAPDFSSTGALSYRWKKPDLILAWSFNLTGPMPLPEVYDLDQEGGALPAPRATRSQTFVIHHLQLTKQIPGKNFSVYGGVENIFNFRQPITPLTGYNDPGVAPGFSDQFDTVYSYAPLIGREYYLGIKWNTGKRKEPVSQAGIF